MTQTGNQLSDFLEKRKALVELAQQLQGVLHTLNMTSWQEKVQQLAQRAKADNFKILVMGEFKRGKSTFINSLLGEEILPSYAIPCTAIINEIKWGDKPLAVLHFLPGNNGQVQKPQNIPVEQIEQYVTIKDEEQRSGSQSVTYNNPYEKIELFWPLEICRNGVEIIDSPGLNEDMKRQKITLDYLSTIDAVIFVIACDFPVSTSELNFISMVKDAGHETVFFVCNRINMIEKPEERVRIRERCISFLAPLTKNEVKHVFFIDARGALQGRLQQNQELVDQSNLPQLEEELHSFLIHERGRVKLMGPAGGLKKAIHAARLAIPEQQKMLQLDLGVLHENYAQAKQGLDRLERERRDIISYMQGSRLQLRNEVSVTASRFYSTAAGNVEGWLKEYDIKEPMKLREVFSGAARERVVAETVSFLIAQVESSFKEWQQKTLEPIITHHIRNLEQGLGEKTKIFALGLDEVKADLVAHSTLNITLDDTQKEQVSDKERIGAAAVGLGLGLTFGDPALAIMGGMFGYKEMIKNILPQLAVAVTAMAILGPVFIIPAVLGAGLVRGAFKANAINQKIRDAAGQEYKQKLLDMQLDMANEIVQAIDSKIALAQEVLDQALGLELQNVDDQVKPVLEAKTQGQTKVDKRLAEIKQANDELNHIDHELDEFIGRIAIS